VLGFCCRLILCSLPRGRPLRCDMGCTSTDGLLDPKTTSHHHGAGQCDQQHLLQQLSLYLNKSYTVDVVQGIATDNVATSRRIHAEPQCLAPDRNEACPNVSDTAAVRGTKVECTDGAPLWATTRPYGLAVGPAIAHHNDARPNIGKRRSSPGRGCVSLRSPIRARSNDGIKRDGVSQRGQSCQF
jgi:hypothetical protein